MFFKGLSKSHILFDISSILTQKFIRNINKILIRTFTGVQRQPITANLTSKANATKRNVIASVSDDTVMRTIHYLVDNCFQFQLNLLLFGHLVIVLGFCNLCPFEGLGRREKSDKKKLTNSYFLVVVPEDIVPKQ